MDLCAKYINELAGSYWRTLWGGQSELDLNPFAQLLNWKETKSVKVFFLILIVQFWHPSAHPNIKHLQIWSLERINGWAYNINEDESINRICVPIPFDVNMDISISGHIRIGCRCWNGKLITNGLGFAVSDLC